MSAQTRPPDQRIHNLTPAQPLVMFFGGAATLLGLLFLPIGHAMGWAAYPWLTWTIRVVEWTAGFRYASVPLASSDLGLLAVYRKSYPAGRLMVYTAHSGGIQEAHRGGRSG
jgi:hypothetical protein